MLEALATFVKALLYAGLLSCAGAVFAGDMLRATPGIARLARKVIQRSALLALIAALTGTAILFFRLGGQWDETTFTAMFMSSSGAALGLQLAGVGLLLASLDDAAARGMRLSNAALIMLSFAFNGHAAAEDLTNGLMAFLHTFAVAWWVGSLCVLRVACTQLKLRTVVELVTRFGAIATRIVGALIIAGLMLVLALVQFEQLPALSSYEWMLAAKLSVVIVLLGAASYNKLRLTPRIALGDATAVRALRRMIDVELVLIAAILVITAILTTYTSPHD